MQTLKPSAVGAGELGHQEVHDADELSTNDAAASLNQECRCPPVGDYSPSGWRIRQVLL